MTGRRPANGSVLVVLVALLAIVAVLGGVLSVLTTTGARTGADQSQSVQAFYHAESGLEWAAWEMRRQTQKQEEDYATACGSLEGYEDPEGRYRIAVLENQGGNCRLEFIGAVPGIDDPLVQRRLRVTVNRQAVEGGDPNVVQDSDNWANACAGGNRSCNEDGSITFSSNSGVDQLNRSGAAGDLVDGDAFTPEDEVFLFLRLREGEGDLTDFGLENVPENGDRVRSVHGTGDLPEGYNAGVSLGDGFTPAQLNDSNNLRFIVEWDGDQVTLEASCIGTRATCEGGADDPAEQWGEE